MHEIVTIAAIVVELISIYLHRKQSITTRINTRDIFFCTSGIFIGFIITYNWDRIKSIFLVDGNCFDNGLERWLFIIAMILICLVFALFYIPIINHLFFIYNEDNDEKKLKKKKNKIICYFFGASLVSVFLIITIINVALAPLCPDENKTESPTSEKGFEKPANPIKSPLVATPQPEQSIVKNTPIKDISTDIIKPIKVQIKPVPDNKQLDVNGVEKEKIGRKEVISSSYLKYGYSYLDKGYFITTNKDKQNNTILSGLNKGDTIISNINVTVYDISDTSLFKSFNTIPRDKKCVILEIKQKKNRKYAKLQFIN